MSGVLTRLATVCCCLRGRNVTTFTFRSDTEDAACLRSAAAGGSCRTAQTHGGHRQRTGPEICPLGVAVPHLPTRADLLGCARRDAAAELFQRAGFEKGEGVLRRCGQKIRNNQQRRSFRVTFTELATLTVHKLERLDSAQMRC